MSMKPQQVWSTTNGGATWDVIPEDFRAYKVVNSKKFHGGNSPKAVVLMQAAVDEQQGGQIEKLYQDTVQSWTVHFIAKKYARIMAKETTRANAERKRIQNERRDLSIDATIAFRESQKAEAAVMGNLHESLTNMVKCYPTMKVKKFVGRWIVVTERTQGTALVDCTDGRYFNADFHHWNLAGFSDFYTPEYLRSRRIVRRFELLEKPEKRA